MNYAEELRICNTAQCSLSVNIFVQTPRTTSELLRALCDDHRAASNDIIRRSRFTKFLIKKTLEINDQLSQQPQKTDSHHNEPVPLNT